MIESILSSDFRIPQEIITTGSSPTDLPRSQYKLFYLPIESKWNLTTQQVANNSLVMEIALIASYNPPYKYLRIRSVGAGFNPANGGEINWNDTYDRGFFQSKIKVHMQPNTNLLTTLSTELKNINNQTQYTTGSEFSVGVDISKNPSFNPSYTISQSTTTVVSDFNILNNGAGNIGDWDFNLAMTQNSIWDAFTEPFLRKGQVKPLPVLATRNLQPVTESVWYASNNLNDNIGIQLYWIATYHHCWVTGNWLEFTEWYSYWERFVGFSGNPVILDFSSVNA